MANISTTLRYKVPLFLVLGTLYFSSTSMAQDSKPYVRIANIVIDSAQLEPYKAALKEHAETAVSREPGVLTLYAVYDKDRPTHVTVFEIYANVPAYQSHIKTAHFLKYKATVEKMVTSLILTDVIPISLQTKKEPCDTCDNRRHSHNES